MQQRVLQLDEIMRRHLSQKDRASNLLEAISLDAKQNQETLQQELRILEKKKQKQREKNRSLKRSLKRSRHKIKAKNRVILHLKRDLQEATSQISNIENSKLWTLYSKLSRLKRFLSRSTRQTVQSMAEYSGHSPHGSPIFQDIEHISASSHAINQTELELANSEHENSERKKTGHKNSDRKNSCGS
jgi:DNA polymerase II small subunit/DNA polymerase delta subunit B